MSLKEMLEAFLRHRREVVTRRTIFDLRKARERAHILEGLAVALANIDEVIALIKAAPAPAEARAALMARSWPPGAGDRSCWSAPARSSTRPDGLAADFGLNAGGYRLSEAQAQAILDMRLHRLTGLEQDKIIERIPRAARAASATCRTSWRARSASRRWCAASWSRSATATATRAAPKSAAIT